MRIVYLQDFIRPLNSHYNHRSRYFLPRGHNLRAPTLHLRPTQYIRVDNGADNPSNRVNWIITGKIAFLQTISHYYPHHQKGFPLSLSLALLPADECPRKLTRINQNKNSFLRKLVAVNAFQAAGSYYNLMKDKCWPFTLAFRANRLNRVDC